MRVATLILSLSILSLIGCSGGSHFIPPLPTDGSTKSGDMATNQNTSPDLAMNQSIPDLSMGMQFGTQKCVDVYDKCYLQMCIDMNNNLDQACVDTCNMMAKNQKTITDAEALVNCVLTAFKGPCSAKCMQPGDAGAYDCRNCLYGTCTMVNGMLSCQGGMCSTQISTCVNDK